MQFQCRWIGLAWQRHLFFCLEGCGDFKVEQSKCIQHKVYSLLERLVFLLKLIFRKRVCFFFPLENCCVCLLLPVYSTARIAGKSRTKCLLQGDERFVPCARSPPLPLSSAGCWRQFPRWKELLIPSRAESPNCVTAFRKWVNGIVIFLPITFYNTDNAAIAGYQIHRPANCGKMILQYNKSNCYLLLICSFVLNFSWFRHLLR